VKKSEEMILKFEHYRDEFQKYFNSEDVRKNMMEAVALLRTHDRIFFIGNGGSNSICSHMMEDYMKMLGKRTSSFTDAAMITCYANDYGWEKAMQEWLKVQFLPGDLLVAISSSGESKNILNAVNQAVEIKGKVITLSGFKPDNSLSRLGDVNIVIPVNSFGIVENFHSVILHAMLDYLCTEKV
jgi:D-sedoheptulose 7-phosphate isomerase